MKMNWSKPAHYLAGAIAITGVVALIGAWFVGAEGTFLGFPQEHLFNDAISLLLVSTAFGIGALYHQQDELRTK